MSVPGHPFDGRAAGCNMLIRDGATLVRGPADVVEALTAAPMPLRQARTADTAVAAAADSPDGSPPAPRRDPPRRPLAEVAALHGQILDRLGPSPVAEDQLIRDLNAPAGAVGAELVTLELEGRIERRPGGLLART